MKYLASCSFGKDSIAAIIARLERGEPVDEAVYCKIMFNDEISAELPEHEEWIYQEAIPRLEKDWGVKTTIVQADKTYCDVFYSKYEKGEKVGRIYGFPFLAGPWCNSRLKTAPIRDYRTKAKGIEIIGIAADEVKRARRSGVKDAILPLVQYDITETKAFEICEKHSLLSPAYDDERRRLGCWFCHNQRIGELRRLRKDNPLLWEQLLKIGKDSPVAFKPDWTVAGLEDRFKEEERQISLFKEGQICL